MELPVLELLGFTIALAFAAVGFGLVGGRRPEAALMMFDAGLFLSAIMGLIQLFVPVALTVVLALLIGWQYARGD